MSLSNYPRNAGPHLSSALAKVFPEGFPVDADSDPDVVPSDRLLSRLRLETARSLFGRDFKDGRALKAWLGKGYEGESKERVNAFNLAMLPLAGVGPDCFCLNEYLRKGGMREVKDLLSWDQALHDFQENARVEEGHQEAPKPYRGTMMWNWARWFDGGRLVYGYLSLAELLLFEAAMDLLQERLDARDPTEMVFEDLPEGGAIVRFLPEDAAERRGAGLRAGYPHLQRLREERWHPAHVAMEPGASVETVEEEGETNCAVVFTSPAAMADIRPKSFLADLSRLRDATEEIKAYKESELELVRAWLNKDFPI